MGLGGRGEVWYTQAVGTYLSHALMCPHTLRVVLERVLGSEQARGCILVLLYASLSLTILPLGSPAAFNKLVRLVTACPSTVTEEV